MTAFSVLGGDTIITRGAAGRTAACVSNVSKHVISYILKPYILVRISVCKNIKNKIA